MAESAKETVVETIRVTGASMVDVIKKLLHEGNIRRIIIRDDKDKVLFEFPMTFGILGAFLSPILTVLATFIVLFKEYTITVERVKETKIEKSKEPDLS